LIDSIIDSLNGSLAHSAPVCVFADFHTAGGRSFQSKAGTTGNRKTQCATARTGGPSIRCSCNLIPPELRVAIGFIAGIALIIGGLTLRRKENVVTAQTLCATGILILYAVTFACRAFYHFSFFGLIPTFAIMTLITAAAFLLSVRMNAIAVAVFGNCRGISHAGGAFERTG
jgi:hypothetical protein